MPIRNADVAKIFNDFADLLEIQGANQFRVRAYRNAARTVGALSRNLRDMVRQGEDLSELPGIGKDLAAKIEEIVRTGSLGTLRELEKEIPRGLGELITVPSLGPKRAKILYDSLGIKSLQDLKRAVLEGKLVELHGFGQKTNEKILEELERRAKGGGERRILLATAEEVGESLIAYLRGLTGVEEAVIAGSYRRRKETVADLDILAIGANAREIIDRFSAYDEVDQVISRGTTLSSVSLKSGVRVDLRVVPRASFGAALVYFTGSKAHNVAIRTIGVKMGLKISEYGVFRNEKQVAGATEAGVYGRIGLSYIEPELREDAGEVDAARRDTLPKLITVRDIRGDLQSHTTATDGRNSLAEMAAAARAKGYDYLAITDHSKRVSVARGLDEKRLAAELVAIDKMNAGFNGFTVLKSCEVDILEDGSLDMPNSVLKDLDFVLCSIHYNFNLPRAKQTERVLRAMDNPYFTILAHPTGRLIGRREPYDIDLERVMKGAKERGCFLEVNAQPERLDLQDINCRMAGVLGVKVAISTDAHALTDLAYMKYGVAQARRGWLGAGEVLNTRSLQELKRLLRRT